MKLLVKTQQRLFLVDADDVIFASIEDGTITVVAREVEGTSNYRTIEDDVALNSNLAANAVHRQKIEVKNIGGATARQVYRRHEQPGGLARPSAAPNSAARTEYMLKQATITACSALSLFFDYFIVETISACVDPSSTKACRLVRIDLLAAGSRVSFSPLGA